MLQKTFRKISRKDLYKPFEADFFIILKKSLFFRCFAECHKNAVKKQVGKVSIKYFEADFFIIL